MIYRFSHFETDDGRRVEFITARRDVLRAERSLNGAAVKWRPCGLDELVVRATPAGARVLADALANVGGDAAVASRMLVQALDDMAEELRQSREPTPERRARAMA